MTISKKGLDEGNPLDCLKLCYLINPDKFKEEFAKVGIDIVNENDLPILEKIVANKVDVTGQLKDENGNPVMFDTMAIIYNIPFTEEEKNKILSFNYSE